VVKTARGVYVRGNLALCARDRTDGYVCAPVGMVVQIVTTTRTALPGLYVGPITARHSTGIG